MGFGSDALEIIGHILIDDDGTAKVERFNKAVGSSGTHMSLLGSAAQGLGRSLEYAFGGLIQAGIQKVGEAVSNFATSLVSEAEKFQNESVQMDAVLKSTNGAAGMTKDTLVGLAESLAKVTRYSAEDTMRGEDLLLTFTKIGKDTFPQATEAMLDMSTALNQDLKSSAIQLGKALQDPTIGMTALRRVGVAFSKDQIEMVKGWVKHGEILKAQKFILAEIQTEFGGSAKAAGTTFAGGLEILNNRLNMVKEKIGTALIPILSQLTQGVLEKVIPGFEAMGGAVASAMTAFSSGDMEGAFYAMVGGIDQAFGPQAAGKVIQFKATFDTFAKGLTTQFGPAVSRMVATFTNSLPMIQKFGADMLAFLQVTVGRLGAFLGPAFAGILDQVTTLWRTHGNDIMAIVNFAWRTIVVIISGVLMVLTVVIQTALTVIQAIFDVASAIMQGNWAQAWTVIKNAAATIWGFISTAFNSFLVMVLSILGVKLTEFKAQWFSNLNAAHDIIMTIMRMIVATILTKLVEIVTFFTIKFNEILAFLNGLIPSFLSVGKGIIDGIWNGINSQFGAFYKDLEYKLNKVVGLTKNIFKSHSPSQVFDDIGQGIFKGMNNGTLKTFPEMLSTMASLSNKLILKAMSTLGGSGQSSTTNNTRSVNFYMNGNKTTRPEWFTSSGLDRIDKLTSLV